MSVDDFAIGKDGERLQLSPDEVRETVSRMMADGDILAVIIRRGDSLAVPVFGPPSLELLEALESATHAYREGLRDAGLIR